MTSDKGSDTTGRGIERNLGDMGDHPRLRVLSDEKLPKIHAAAIEILETVGVMTTRPEAVQMMADAGCIVSDGDVVMVPERIVEDAISSAPRRIAVFNRDGEEALEIGGQDVFTHTGYTPLEFFDIDTGERRDYTLDDFRLVARVADALENVDFVGQSGVVRPSAENPLEVINHLEVEAMLTNTSKPLHLLVASGEILQDCLEMAEAIAVANGAKSLAERPFVMPFLNPISPLVYNDETIDKILIAADWGIPVICGPSPIAGGTAPATLAGTIAMQTAEILFGLVMSQIRRKGTPYILWVSGSNLDMKTGQQSRWAERQLIVNGNIEMGHYYGVPISGGGAGFDQYGVLDGWAGWSQMMGGLMAMLTGGNAAIGVGAGSSLESAVASNELIGMLKVMMKGVPVDDETLAVDVVREIGAGGRSFLRHPHTFQHFRDYWNPGLLANLTYETWEAGGKMTLMDRAKEVMREIMATHEPKPIPEEAKPKIAEIIARARARANGAT